METPRGLLVVLALLSLGACVDVAAIWQGGVGVWIAIVVLVGRIAAISGILMRTQKGWFLAIGFFVLIIILNALAAMNAVNPFRAVAGLIVPLGCAVYLLMVRDEFD